VVVDEASMLDLPLALSLVRAVPRSAQLLLVGDPDQLPSVGPGNVLADLMASGRVPVTRLTRIFRQAEGSTIVSNAHRINRGVMPTLERVPLVAQQGQAEAQVRMGWEGPRVCVCVCVCV
jgi:exodeoxyribonuclease V alpha subunit